LSQVIETYGPEGDIIVEIYESSIVAGSSVVQGYTHLQSTPLAEWIINHNLGYRPVIEVFNLLGDRVFPAVRNPSVNQSRVFSVVPFAGEARLL
jgi:hypothetical protein